MRIAAIICFVLSVGVIGAWAAMGAHPVTHYQVQVDVEIEDEFGDKQVKKEWKDKFEFGMLPDKPWDGALTWILVLDGLGAALFVGDMMARKKKASAG